MAKVTILHLSDLHYTSSSRADILIIFNALVCDLLFLKENNNLSPDFVIFSGDIVQDADIMDDFEKSKAMFIDPLLQSLRLSNDFFFMAPGNHDIQKSKINEYMEIGLEKKLISRSELNSFIDKIDNNKPSFDRLSNYKIFEHKLLSKYVINSDLLYSTFYFKINDINIGIACLNSSWRASGLPDNLDHGKLLIGERQIDKAATDIKDAYLKIGVIHHPFEWLKSFDAQIIKRRAFAEFDFLLFGHNHDSSQEVIDRSSDVVLVSNSGCLYKSRDYLIAYSLIEYDFDLLQASIYVRSYSDIRRKFDKSVIHAPEGIIQFPFYIKTHNVNYFPLPIKLIDKISSIVIHQANHNLLSATPESIAPKDLKTIFVEPILCERSKETLEADYVLGKKEPELKQVSIKEIILSEDNFMIIGKKESGKTTLLNYISLVSLQNEFSSLFKLPFYINCRNLPSGKAAEVVQKAMVLNIFDKGAYRDINIDDYLKKGKCLILFDDFTFRDNKILPKIKQFISLYPLNKYIFAINEEHDFMLDIERYKNIMDIKLNYIFIHSFDRKRIRKLIDNWFSGIIDIDKDRILNNVMDNIYRLNIPRSPAFISLLLCIFEKEDNFVPSNKASLLEKIIEMILEKMKIHEDRFDKIDYRDKEHFLSYIAYLMVSDDRYYIDNKMELEKKTIDYFEKRGLNIPIGNFIKYFFDRGIFLELPNKSIIFKYSCFCEYFIAKRMIEDNIFYNKIMMIDNYLRFINEIDYLTGLQRNNKELVSVLSNRSDDLFKNISTIDISIFDKIHIGESIFDGEEGSDILKKVDEIGDEERDNFLDPMITISNLKKMEFIRLLKEQDQEGFKKFIDNSFPNKYSESAKNELFDSLKMMDDEQIIEWFSKNENKVFDSQFIEKSRYQEIYNDSEALYFMHQILYSMVIKNCELIEDLPFREKNLDKCIMYWARLILFNLKQIEDKPQTGEIGNRFSKKDMDYMNVFFPSMIQSMISSELGSDKLEILLNHGIDNAEPNIVKYIYTIIYSDLKLPRYIKKLEQFVKSVEGNRYYLELILYKLHYYLFIYNLKKNEHDEIVNMISEIMIKRDKKTKLSKGGIYSGAMKKYNETKEKNKIMQKLRDIENKKKLDIFD